MKPVQQTKTGPLRGDCLAACVATIFEVRITDLPDLSEFVWHRNLRQWLHEKQLSFVYIECGDKIDTTAPDGLSIACYSFYVNEGEHIGEKRKHCVVAHEGRTLWDPWPGSGSFSQKAPEEVSWIVFTTLDPSRVQIRPGL
jgi:hypothetical protein